MHTYLVTFVNGETETIRSEGIETGPTHLAFLNVSSEPYGSSRLVVALHAASVLRVEEIDEQEDEPC